MKDMYALITLFALSLTSSVAMADLDDPDESSSKQIVQPSSQPKPSEPDLGSSGPAKPPSPDKDIDPEEKAILDDLKAPPPKGLSPAKPAGPPATQPSAPATESGTSPVSPLRPRQGEGHDNTAPISWKAKGFRGTREGKLIELRQDVEVLQDKMRLTADRADIYFDQGDELSKVNAFGNVKIRKEALLPKDRITARGNEAIFYNAERKIILKGKALLSRGSDIVRGKQISYDLDTGWITVDAVEGVVQPGETNKP